MLKLIFDNPPHEFMGKMTEGGPRKVRKAQAIRFESRQGDSDGWMGGDHIWDIIRDADTNRVIAEKYEPGSWWIVGRYTYDRLRIEVDDS